MGRFDNGVGFYTRAKVEIYFPEDDVKCAWCQLLGTEMVSGRKYCKKTGELLVAPDATIGCECPLKFEREEDHAGEYAAI